MNKQISRNPLSKIIIIATVALICSCFGKTPPATFYMLQAMPEEKPRDRLSQEIFIAVGPVAIPSEMDRPQIIIRDQKNRIRLSETHRWAAPLPDSIASVLSTNLSVLLGTDRIMPRHHSDLFPVTHYIVLNINRFDGQLQKEVLLDVTWSIQKNQHLEPLFIKRSVIHEPVLYGDYHDLVGAQSKALFELSRQIASSVMELQE